MVEKTEIKLENARELMSKIQEDARLQCEEILLRAQKEAQQIFYDSRQQSHAEKESILKDGELEIAKLRDKIFSTLNLEKKKIRLKSKSDFFQEVMAGLNEQAENFRRGPEYWGFLIAAVSEGVRILDTRSVRVIYSRQDENTVNDEFKRHIEGDFSAEKTAFIWQKGDFNDIGAVIESQDNHISYDNRFRARLSRCYDAIYMELMGELK